MRFCVIATAHPIDDVRVKSRICDSLLGAGVEVVWIGPAIGKDGAPPEGDPRVAYRLRQVRAGRWQRYKNLLWGLINGLTLGNGCDYLYSPDPDAFPVVLMIGRLLGKPTVLDVHEEFHLEPVSRRFGRRSAPVVANAVRASLKWLLQRGDVVIAVNTSVAKAYSVETRAVILRNSVSREFAARIPASERSYSSMQFVHGKDVPGNGTEVVVDAGKLVHTSLGDAFKITMFGGDYARRIAPESAESWLDLRPRCAFDAMPGELQRCHVGIIAYGRELGVGSLPNRLFEYMAAGLAVIAPKYSVHISEIVRDAECGMLVDCESSTEVANAIRWLLAHPTDAQAMGERARTYFVERLAWEAEFSDFLTYLTETRVGHTGRSVRNR